MALQGAVRQAKFVVSRPLIGQTLTLSGGGLGAPVDVVIADDEVHYLDELLVTLNSQLVTALSGISQILSFTILTSSGAAGFVEIGYTSASAITIDWSQAADFRDYCALTGATTQQVSSSTPIRGTRGHKGGFYPEWYLTTDSPTLNDRTAIGRPDQGNTNVLHISGTRGRTLGIQAIYAEQRAAQWNEWYAMVEFLREIKTGRAFKYWPDETVNQPYAEISEGYGYHYLTADPDSVKIPRRANDSGEIHWTTEFDCYEWRKAWRLDL